jgi:hypothetical protein
MDRNQPFSEPNLPADIVKLALEQHGPVIRLAYMEIASGINRLLRRGIPKAVVTQVLSQTVEALAKMKVTKGADVWDSEAASQLEKWTRSIISAVESPSPRYAIACKLLRLKLEKIAEADIRSAYGEFVQYPEVGEVSAQVYKEAVRWLEFMADLDAFSWWVMGQPGLARLIHQFESLELGRLLAGWTGQAFATIWKIWLARP